MEAALNLAVTFVDPANPTLQETAIFTVGGFLLVMAVLAILATITFCLGKVFVRFTPKPENVHPKAVKNTAPIVAAAPEPVEEMPTEKIAAIAAAVAVVVRDPHRIVSIRPSGRSGHWSAEGRRQIFQSHRVK